MKQVVVLLLFIFLFFFASSQKNTIIYVSEWINKPKTEEFSKPLIFIDFWATWCGPCISSMPHTEYLSEIFNNDVLFFFISDEPSGKIKAFMKKRDKHFYSASDNTGKNIKNFNITHLPFSVLIDTDGNIIWKGRPTEMNQRLLKRFINLYKNEKGFANRIIKLKDNSNVNKLDWKTFKTPTSSSKYIQLQNIPNEFKNSNDSFYISGNIKYFVSNINNIPISHIKSNIDDEETYMFLCNNVSKAEFKKNLTEFLKIKCKLNISKDSINQIVYFIKDTTDENFFNKNMYDYGKGNDAFLVDDFSLTIDNATIEEMTNLLSNYSKNTFIYNSTNNNIYDWNIHYKYLNLTLEQLKKELNFIVIPKQKFIPYYYISK